MKRYFHKDAVIAVGDTIIQNFVPVRSGFGIRLTKLTLSITTHAAVTVTFNDDSLEGPPVAAHTDAAAAAGVLSVVKWDFGESGLLLAPDSALNITMSSAGIVGRAYAEGFYTASLTDNFTPDDLDGLAAWLRADAGIFSDADGTVPITADGESLVAWEDQANGALVDGEASPPVYKTGIINGRPAILFTAASSQYMTGTDTTVNSTNLQDHTPYGGITPSAPGLTMFIVAVDTTAGAAARNLIGHSTNSATTNRHTVNIGAGVMRPRISIRRLDADASQTLTSAAGVLITQNVPFIFATVIDHTAALGSAYRNGTEAVASTALTSGVGPVSHLSAARVRIGSTIANTPVDFWDGYIAEIIIYRRALPTSERDQVESYLGNKYGITVA